MNNRTLWRPDLAELAYNYQNDDTQAFIAEQAMPFKGLQNDKGSFRSPTEDTYYNQPNMAMSRTGYPNSFNWTDGTTNFDLKPYGGSFEFNNQELSQWQLYGYSSQADMIARNIEWLAVMAKLNLEVSFASFMTTTSNFASGFYVDINATSTKWNDLNNSDPLKDVLAAKETLWGVPTDMIIGQQMLHYLMQHPKIRTATTVMGAKRDKGVDPTVTPDFLANYFGVPRVWVSSGIYNTSPNTPATMTKGYIWDSAYVWLGVLDKGTSLNPMNKSFAYALSLSVPNVPKAGGNWIAKETIDERAGGVGMHYFDLVFYMQYKLRAQKLGYLMTNAIV